jgi:hypothetical protein
LEWGTENAPTRLEPIQVMKVEGAAAKTGRVWGPVGIGVGAAAVLAAGLGVGFAVGSQDAQKAAANATRDASGRITSLTQRDAFALDARAKGDVGAASAFFVSAAVLAAAGAGLIIFDRVSAAPGPGGVALVVPLDANFGFAHVEGRR